MQTISENKVPQLQPPHFTPPPAYQYLGNNAPVPSAPHLQQQSTSFNGHSYETPLHMQQSTALEIPQPSSILTNKKRLIPSVKLMDIRNPPPIDFDQLKLTANKMHNRSHSLDILRNDEQPHTNEVTYCDSHSADTYEV